MRAPLSSLDDSSFARLLRDVCTGAFPNMSSTTKLHNQILGECRVVKLPGSMLVSDVQLEKGFRLETETGALACVSLPSDSWLKPEEQESLVKSCTSLRELAAHVPRGNRKASVSSAGSHAETVLPGFVSSGIKQDHVCLHPPLPPPPMS